MTAGMFAARQIPRPPAVPTAAAAAAKAAV